MTNIPDWWKANANKPNVLVPVYIVNLDIAQSSSLEGHDPLTFKRTVNSLQDQIERELHKAGFFFQSWSGDGLVALYDGKQGSSNDCIENVIKICTLFKKFKNKQQETSPYIWRSVDLRIGIVFGSVPYDEQMGRIIGIAMDIAGHFQKDCPLGSILIDEEVHHRLTDRSKLKARFEQDVAVLHGSKHLAAYSIYSARPSTLPSFPEYEENILQEFWKRRYEIVVRAPASFFIVGEFASIFGYPALILPIPLFSYVGISPGANGVEVEQVKVVEETSDCWGRRNMLRLVPPMKEEPVNEYERKIIWSTLGDSINKNHKHTGVKILNLSMIPTRCGLGASSAFCTGLALASSLLFQALSNDSFNTLQGFKQPFISVAESPFWKVYKLAWALENIFEGGASSGGAAFASLFGSFDGFPLIYMGEKRGFDGGFPFYFADGGTESSLSDLDFKRIRSTAYRTRDLTDRNDIGLDYALLFTTSRNKWTGNLIDDFFKNVSETGDTRLIDKIAERSMKTYDLSRESILRLAKRSLNDQILARELPSRFTDQDRRKSGKRDLFVEWVAQTLGCIAFAAQGAFLSFSDEISSKPMRSFLRHLNAYQEILSAIGVSVSLADLYNYRSDLFQYEVPGGIPYQIGTKLIGSGRGGDFLVMAPHGELARTFPMLRRRLAIGQCPPACHFFSWHDKAVQLPPATVAGWRLGERGYEKL